MAKNVQIHVGGWNAFSSQIVATLFSGLTGFGLANAISGDEYQAGWLALMALGISGGVCANKVVRVLAASEAINALSDHLSLLASKGKPASFTKENFTTLLVGLGFSSFVKQKGGEENSLVEEDNSRIQISMH